MPRIARAVLPGIPYHITQRGNNCQDVFFVDDDRRKYLTFLSAQSERYALALHGYCLMRNHVHLIVTPYRADSLAKAIGRTHFLYTLYINRLHNRSGHLWQNRFFSCPLDDEHYLAALRYTERNPVRAGIVREPWRYEWSSAAVHAGIMKANSPTLYEGPLPLEDWRTTLASDVDQEMIIRLRHGVSNGRPLGDDAFLRKIETLLGRRLRALPVGRPKKK